MSKAPRIVLQSVSNGGSGSQTPTKSGSRGRRANSQSRRRGGGSRSQEQYPSHQSDSTQKTASYRSTPDSKAERPPFSAPKPPATIPTSATSYAAECADIPSNSTEAQTYTMCTRLNMYKSGVSDTVRLDQVSMMPTLVTAATRPHFMAATGTMVPQTSPLFIAAVLAQSARQTCMEGGALSCELAKGTRAAAEIALQTVRERMD